MLSIVIPAYNEEKRLPGSLVKIQSYLSSKEIDAEIIVVVEKSEDRTLDVVKQYLDIYPNLRLIENDRRYGKGYSVRRGVMASRGDLVLFTDSDLSVPISQIERFMPYFNEYECCIGQRVQIKKQPVYRRAMGIGFRYLNRFVTGLGYRDT